MQPLAAHGLEARFAQALDALGVAAGERVLVAVSGGADSVALLRLFCGIREERRLTLAAAHLDHGMRGQASEEDARFVSGLCKALGIPCIQGERDVSALAAQLKTGPEDAARQARYAFLEEARATAGARYVALAHHLEDQAETVLLRLTRGCGLAGLTGMGSSRGAYIRPLLGERRGALRDYLRRIGQQWREDETNADPAYARNFVRTRAMPALESLNPNLAPTLAALAGRLALDEDCLSGLAHGLLDCRPMPYGLCLRTGPLHGTHEALRRRALMAAWDGLEGLERLQAHQVEALSALLDRPVGASCNLPGDWRGLRGRERLHLLAPGALPDPLEGQAVPLKLEGETRWPGGLLRARPAKPGELGDGVRIQVLDGDALQGATIRFRRPGDRFQPLGSAGSQPLKQTLIDRGVDRPFRGLIPLVVRDGRALWLIGLLPGNDAAVTPRTVRPIHYTFEGELPWD